MLREQPEATFVDLSDHDIESLTSLVPLLAKFANLEEVNLSNNTFTQMPKDLSTWKKVTNVNLSNVNFDDFEDCVTALATLPGLKSLYINLFEES